MSLTLEQRARAVIATLAFIAGVAFYAVVPPAFTHDTPDSVGQPAYTGSVTRTSYQRQLNLSIDRFQPEFDIVLLDGQLWIRTDAKPTDGCKIRCGVLTYDKHHFTEVTLPVGYVHESNVSPMPRGMVPVTRLTYWDMDTHRPVTITRGDQDAVTFPYKLRHEQTLSYLKRGEVAYVWAYFVRRAANGQYLLSPEATVRREPLGEQFGYAEDALIVRRSNSKGIEVMLPSDYDHPPSDDGYISDYWTPITAIQSRRSPIVPDIRAATTKEI